VLCIVSLWASFAASTPSEILSNRVCEIWLEIISNRMCGIWLDVEGANVTIKQVSRTII